MNPLKSNIQDNNAPNLPDARKEKLYAFNKETYGDIIRKSRQNRGYNQPQLAEILGVSKNLVSNWEAGRSRPDINILPQLCRTLDISISTFFGLPGRDHELTLEEQTHITNYRHLTTQNRELVDFLMNTMLDQTERELRRHCERGFERKFKNAQLTAAGTGNHLDDHCNGQYVYVQTDRNACRADEIITVTGNSMEPTFHNGDDLFIEHVESLLPGEIGIFTVNGDGYVKEYQPDGLHSHNPAYPVIHFTEGDDVRCVGRVLGIVEANQYATDAELKMLEEIRHEKESR